VVDILPNFDERAKGKVNKLVRLVFNDKPVKNGTCATNGNRFAKRIPNANRLSMSTKAILETKSILLCKEAHEPRNIGKPRSTLDSSHVRPQSTRHGIHDEGSLSLGFGHRTLKHPVQDNRYREHGHD